MGASRNKKDTIRKQNPAMFETVKGQQIFSSDRDRHPLNHHNQHAEHSSVPSSPYWPHGRCTMIRGGKDSLVFREVLNTGDGFSENRRSIGGGHHFLRNHGVAPAFIAGDKISIADDRELRIHLNPVVVAQARFLILRVTHTCLPIQGA